MSIELAQMEIPVRATGMDAVGRSMNSMRTTMVNAFDSMKRANDDASAKIASGLQNIQGAMGHLQQSAQGVAMKLTEMAGLNLGPMISQVGKLAASFGPVGVAVGAVVVALGLAVKAASDFIAMNDEKIMLGEKMRFMGMDVDANTKKLDEFTMAMRRMGNDDSQTRAMISRNLSMGASMEDAMRRVRAAHGLANADVGVSIQQAQRMIMMYEEMGSAALRRLPMARAWIKEGLSDQEIQKRLNNLIQQGNELHEKRMELTTGGQIEKMKIALLDVWDVMKQVFGPPVMMLVKSITNTVRGLVDMFNSIKSQIVETFTPVYEAFMNVKKWFTDLLKTLGIEGGEGFSIFRVQMEIALLPLRAMIGLINLLIKSLQWLGENTGILDFFKWIGKGISDLVAKFKPLIDSIKGLLTYLGILKNTKPGEALGDAHISPGMTAKASTMSADKLWEKVQMGALEGGVNHAQQTAQNTQQMSNTIANWAANGVPVAGSPRPLVPA